MTSKERYEDIKNKSGLSLDIIKRVLTAERESVLESLRRGDKAVLIGRCIIKPEVRSKLLPGGDVKNYIDLKVDVTTSLKASLEEMDGFDIVEEAEDSNIRLRQIPSLM